MLLGIVHGVQFIMLLIAAVIDIKTKTISVLILIGIAISTFFSVWLETDNTFVRIGISLLPGLALLLIAKLTKEGVGSGDAWLILLIGPSLGPGRILICLCVACFLVSLFALTVLMLKKVKVKSTLPFIPFISVAYLLAVLC